MPIEPRNKVSVKQAILPVVDFVSRLSLVFLMLFCVGLLAVSKIDHDAARYVRTQMLDFTAPAINLMLKPVETFQSLQQDFSLYVNVHSDNKALRVRNEYLEHANAVMVQLKVENERLRLVAHMLPDQSKVYYRARVVADNNRHYSKTGIIASGTNHGLRAGQVVTTSRGLVGRLTDVGSRSARVLYIADIKSRVPVLVGTQEQKAILVGGNNQPMSLSFVSEDADINAGDRIVSSGDGQFFPADVPVGFVQSVTEDTVSVKPFVDFQRLGYVTIVDLKESVQ